MIVNMNVWHGMHGYLCVVRFGIIKPFLAEHRFKLTVENVSLLYIL